MCVCCFRNDSLLRLQGHCKWSPRVLRSRPPPLCLISWPNHSWAGSKVAWRGQQGRIVECTGRCVCASSVPQLLGGQVVPHGVSLVAVIAFIRLLSQTQSQKAFLPPLAPSPLTPAMYSLLDGHAKNMDTDLKPRRTNCTH